MSIDKTFIEFIIALAVLALSAFVAVLKIKQNDDFKNNKL